MSKLTGKSGAAKDKGVPALLKVRAKVEEALDAVAKLDPQENYEPHLLNARERLEQTLRLVDKHIERSSRRADLPD